MKSDEFKKNIIEAVNTYIGNFDRFDNNPQLRVNPATLAVTLVNGSDMLTAIGDNDEAIEAAAASHGMANQEAADFQVTQNPDFYSLKTLIKATPDGGTVPDDKAVDAIVKTYFTAK